MCANPPAPLLFGGHFQLVTKFPLLSVTSVLMGEGSSKPEEVLGVNSERSECGLLPDK